MTKYHQNGNKYHYWETSQLSTSVIFFNQYLNIFFKELDNDFFWKFMYEWTQIARIQIVRIQLTKGY